LTGGRDKRGGAILSFLAYQSIVDKLKYDDLRMLITYLASIPRYDHRFKLTVTDHLSGEPGNVREFETCHGKILVMEKCPKTIHY